jgi:hypothetical protein
LGLLVQAGAMQTAMTRAMKGSVVPRDESVAAFMSINLLPFQGQARMRRSVEA